MQEALRGRPARPRPGQLGRLRQQGRGPVLTLWLPGQERDAKGVRPPLDLPEPGREDGVRLGRHLGEVLCPPLLDWDPTGRPRPARC